MVGVLKFSYFCSLNLQQSFNSLNIFLYAFSPLKGIKACTCENKDPPREYVGIRGINVVLPPRK